MSYPLERKLPQLATVRVQATMLDDQWAREIIVQLCDAVDYLNAKIHAVADATATPLEE